VDHKINRQSPFEILKQFLRFNFVGVVNTALTYGIYSGLVFLGLHHIAAVVIEYAFGIVFSYQLNKHFTFAVKKRTDRYMFVRMIIAYVPMLLLNTILLWMLIDRLHWNKYLGQAVAQGFVVVLSFLAQRIFVFRIHREMNHGK
jgi:putative flippase GtrA